VATAGTGVSRQAAAGVVTRARRPGALIRNVAVWSVLFLMLVFASILIWPDVGPRMGPYWSGLLTLILFAWVALYAARKRNLWLSLRVIRIVSAIAQPLGKVMVIVDRLESWRAFHVTVGVVALLPFWWHMQTGLRGPLETALLAAVILLFVSGFFGVFLQQYFPHAMSKRAEHEVRLKDVDSRIREVYVQAEEKILGHQEPLIHIYLDYVKPILLGETPRSTLLWATLRGRDPGAARCSRAAAMEKELTGDVPIYRELLALAERKVNLEHNAFNLHLSTSWLTFHIVVSAAVGVLVAFHVLAVIYFYGL
jgi:hypothetical protein